MQLWINSLPGEVLDRILARLSVEEVFAFVDPITLHQNPGIRKAVINRVNHAPLLAHNRLQQTYLVMYLLSPNFLAKLAMEPIHIDNLEMLWMMESTWGLTLSHPVTMSYHIWNLLAATDLLNHLKRLENSNLEYNIEIEFDPSILPKLSMFYLINQIARCAGAKIRSILILNYEGGFTFDPSMIPNLNALWIENSDVSFAGPFSPLLKWLCLHPNRNGYARNRPVHINCSLPCNASSILLGNCLIDSSSDKYPFPHLIRTLSLENIKDLTPSHYLRRLMEENQHLRSLTLVNSISTTDLKTLDSFGVSNVQKPNWDLGATYLTSLQISRSALRDIVLPDTLRELNISNNGIVDLQRIHLPESLVSLKVSDNPIDWTAGVWFPPRLKYLDLGNTGIKTLKPFVFPDSVEILILAVNKIESIDGIKFPSKLRLLAIGMNKITQVVNPILPRNIHTIHFTENHIGNSFRLLNDQDGNPLNLKVLFINHNRITDFSAIKYPRSVEILNLDNNNILSLRNVEFSPNIQDLSFRGCDLSYIRNVTFAENSKLITFIMSLNDLKTIDRNTIQFPPSVQLINFGGCAIDSVDPETFTHLPSLRHLSFAGNKLKSLVLSLPSSVRELDVCCNKIRRLRLNFPVNCDSSLAALNISQNKLSKFSPTMIGHGVNGVYHQNLVEIDITNNKITDNYMAAILDDMPKSLVACFVGYTGTQDSYGYDIGQNILDHPLCLGKRIDVSHL